ncbi:metalloregulator ArsR/SmtB family transcription factor [Lactiplantibacillus sp. WILCCON 0030]|uniref:Metalloregulator ArsR/SmtB family transcription factor n=1 Tax=Lactiplantibacillus brownii TaxID=3069269 RepID=A0ABU1ABU1_9LACO|nr:metalloregulator ArsR/SmtB family transcription factor [Lactiplantibacillus brownii]MDQ7938381.1 metalloregulator ArsR/SmtB family transcription factor [Lactiplantibacillus brownii]
MLNATAINYKDSLYGELAKVGKSLSSERRLEIMDLLAQGPKTVEAISTESKMSIANTSRHLQVLREGNLVARQKSGKFVYYTLATNKVVALFYLLRDVGEEQLSAIRQIQADFNRSEQIESITLPETLEKMKQGNVVLLDVRPESEYSHGHIDQAENIPIDDLQARVTQLSKDQEIIVYCRGSLCAYANMATHELNEQGYHAYSLNESYYDWQQAIK